MIDLFGKRIQLTHEGKEVYKNNLGATCSIIYLIIILVYSLVSLAKVWRGEIKSVTYQTAFIDLNVENQIVSIDEVNLKFAVGFNDYLPANIGKIYLETISVI